MWRAALIDNSGGCIPDQGYSVKRSVALAPVGGDQTEKQFDAAMVQLGLDWQFDPIRNEPQFSVITARMSFPAVDSGSDGVDSS